MTAQAVAAPGETAVEVVLPEGGNSLQLSCSGWSWVPGVDAVGGSPHGYFTDDAGAWLAAGRRPNGLRAVLAGLISNAVGEVGNELGLLGQILTPNGLVLESLGDYGKPGQWAGVGVCGFWEAPVQDGGPVSCRG